jgi:membrane-bound serine protease (ClpP class)
MRRALLLALLVSALATAAYTASDVFVVEVSGVVGYHTLSQINRAISMAGQSGGLVLLLLSTPGGLASATLDIMKSIGNSPVPVVGYVYPDYSYAWSAGTYILMSTHIAAMAPHTVIGSCQPVAGERPVNESKVINALIAYLEVVARSYGRNASFARHCIAYNLNLGADEALKYRVIDVIAADVSDLLRRINGSDIVLGGERARLMVLRPSLHRVEPSIGELLQHALCDPVLSSALYTLAFLLLLAALITGHPAAAAAAILMLLFAMLPTMPTAWLWAVLAIAGATLMAAEALAGMPAHGALMAAGAALVLAGLVSAYPASAFSGELIRVRDWWLVQLGLYANVAVMTGFLALVLYKAVSAHRRRPASELLVNLRGAEGVAADDIAPGSPGFVIVLGEYWRAVSDVSIRRGCRVRVVDVYGSVLKVEPIERAPANQLQHAA